MKKKIVSLFVALMLVAVAIPASAATIEELQAMIASLTAQISALSGTPAVITNASTSMFDKDLTIGATGANVSDLQGWLVSNEYLVMPVGVSYGYFGPLTKSAVIKFQLANGVPGTGYFGPMSRSALNATLVVIVPTLPVDTGELCPNGMLMSNNCAAPVEAGVTCPNGMLLANNCAAAGDTTGDGITTIGMEGSIEITRLSSPSNAKLSEGEIDLKVAGFSVEAIDSDVLIQSAKITFSTSGTTKSQYPWKYFQTIKLYAGDTLLGEVAADTKDAWSETGSTKVYAVRFNNISSLVLKDKKVNLYVVVDALSTIDSGNLDRIWSVDILASDLRVIDGVGLSQYDSTGPDARTFTVEGVTNATLTIKSNSATPLAGTIAVSATVDTLAVPVLDFGVKATGSNVDLTEMVINLASTTAIVSMEDMVGNVELYHGKTLVASANVSTYGVVTFNLTGEGVSIAKDATEVFTVKIDVKALAGTSFTTGDAVKASVTSVTGEDSSGTEVSDLTGVTGNAIAFSLSVVTVTTSWIVPSAGNLIDFKFVVTAGDDEDYTVLFSDITSSTSGTATTGVGVLSKIAGTATETSAGVSYTVLSGDDATFQVRYPITGVNGTYANVTITSVAGQPVLDDEQVSPTAVRNIAT